MHNTCVAHSHGTLIPVIMSDTVFMHCKFNLLTVKYQNMKKTVVLLLMSVLCVFGIKAYSIYPIPQKMVENGGSVSLTNRVNVVLEEGISNKIKAFAEEVLTGAGLTPVFSGLSSSDSYLYIGVNGSGGEADGFADESGLPRNVFSGAANQYDPYVLQVNTLKSAGSVVIIGDSDGSAFYGLSTLKQMLMGGTQLSKVTIEDYAYTQYRGIVEGYYGTPYSVESIIALLEFFKEYKLNTFIYGPKGDPYHAGYWQEDYPVTVTETERKRGLLTQDDMRRISEKARECNVHFIWAIHPAMANAIDFSSPSAMDPGIDKIMEKFGKMYDLGVRGFGVFIDDIATTPSATMTAYLPEQVYAKLKAKYNTPGSDPDDNVSPLFFVPQQYSLDAGSSSLTSLSSIDPEIVIAFTGSSVWSNINNNDCQRFKNIIGRNPLMWWNNPCNDNYDDRIYMHEMTYRYTAQNAPVDALGGVVANPMQEGQASKIFMFGLADYCWNTASFDATANWEASFGFLFRDDAELAEAFKTFCINSESTIEPYELTSLYSSFRNSYYDYYLPEPATSSLISKMDELNAAFSKVATMKDSENEAYSLMYKDISPWLGKLTSMTGIISTSLKWMQSPGSIDNWTDYTTAVQQYDKLHSDPAFKSYVLEGSGTAPWERYVEATPASYNMEPFVDFVMGKYGTYAPEFPSKDRSPKIIHNLSYLPSSVTLSTSENEFTLNGLSNVSLAPGECIGIFMNEIKEIAISPMNAGFPDEFRVEYSLDGKNWLKVEPDGSTYIEMAYFRIRNVTEGATHTVGADILKGTSPQIGLCSPTNVSTNMPQYQYYSISNVINYNTSSYFWSSRNQQVGDYVTVDLGGESGIYKVELDFQSDDQPAGKCVIEISSDGNYWEEVNSFSPSDIKDNQYVCVVQGDKTGRYVRLKVTEIDNNKWFRLVNFKIYNGREISAAKDDKDIYTDALDDCSLNTHYTSDAAGYIDYQFIDDINIEEITIYNNSTYDEKYELPSLTIYAGGNSYDMGTLDEATKILDVASIDGVSSLRIEWNDTNIPDIYEISVDGTPYTEGKDLSGIEEVGETEEPLVFFAGDRMYIKNCEGKIATVYGSNGVELFGGKVDENFSIEASNKGVYIIKIGNRSFKAVH